MIENSPFEDFDRLMAWLRVAGATQADCRLIGPKPVTQLEQYGPREIEVKEVWLFANGPAFQMTKRIAYQRVPNA
jgi:hypothetical protein